MGNKWMLDVPKIGLDIDDVIAAFIPAFAKYFDLPDPTSWNWSYRKAECFQKLMSDKAARDDFYANIPPLIDPSSIPFEPHCYCTARSIIPQSVTESWIERNGFPCSPVISVPFNVSKVKALREAGVEVFVDDKFETFKELNKAGITCFLFDSSHNRRYDVGSMRIKALHELPWF